MIDDEKIRLQDLAYKWLNGSLTDAEQLEFDSWFVQTNIAPMEVPGSVAENKEQYRQLIFSRITEELAKTSTGKTKKLWPRIAGIAAAVAAIVFGVWFFSTLRHLEGSAATRDLYANDIAPGKNTAILKIGDGEAITLSDKQTGVIVGRSSLKYNDGSAVGTGSANNVGIASEATQPRNDVGGRMLTVRTPRGGTYQVTLPDGTKVWLNAASVLTYTMPLNERGGVRQVKLSGEAYFEVFRNKNQPFVVTAKNLTTTVLGTHFNISAYDDEGSSKATLLEGSVRVTTLSSRVNAKDLDSSYPRNDKGVSNDERSLPAVRDDGDGVTLTPNQQASITNNISITVKTVDANEAIAWKNGLFQFYRADIKTVMQQLARWYNVEVTYEGNLPKREFTGKIFRNVNASQALNLLKSLDVNFRIEGKKIIVTK